MNEPSDARVKPLFSVAEAAAHAGTNATTVITWFCGDKDRNTAPLFAERARKRDSEIWLSFLEVVEVIVARRFRRHRVSLEQLRLTREHARKRWEVEYPLAERHLKLLGGRVLDQPGQAVDTPWSVSQPVLPKFVDFATEVFEYEHLEDGADHPAWASRFFPAGQSVPLMVDPRFAGGAVAFLNRGLTLETVVDRWRAKESISFIASDFDLTEHEVEAALRFALAA